MKIPTQKRMYIIALAVLLVSCISAYCIYRENRSIHNKLMQDIGLVYVNPRKVLTDIDQIDRRFLTEHNYYLCDLLKAGGLVHTQEFVISDSLLNFVSPYFKYKNDSLLLADIYYYKGEIASHSNFLLEAIEYYTLCVQYSNGKYDSVGLDFYLNNFKGKAYHAKRVKNEEKAAKLTALKQAKKLNDRQLMEEAYSELTYYYAEPEDYNESIPILKEAAEKGYSGSLQTRILFLLGEKYAENGNPDSALIYTRQIPHLYQDSIDYLLGNIYFHLQQSDSARFYLNKGCHSDNPFLCFKSYRLLLDLNVRTGSMNGVSDCLANLTRYKRVTDSIENHITLAQIEDVERLRKTIRYSETEEMKYYKSWIVYFWIMIVAFAIILILLFTSIALQKKKKNLQLKRQQARLDALKMQIDPHFIFNNLSILLDLVETGDTTAPEYVKALSKVYRYIVSNVDKNLSTIEEELACLKSYIYLLKIRFGDTIQINIQVENTIKGRQIPPIVLQMLLENALKHNRASEDSPLSIRVYSQGEKLIVENDRRPILSSVSSRHIGLRNIQERYLLTGAPSPEIYEDENIYRVILPTLQP